VKKLGGLSLVLVCALGVILCAKPGSPAKNNGSPRSWGKPGREEPSTFDKPRCVALAPDGTLYVLDLTGRIQHFTPAGKYLDELHMPDVSVGRPQGIDIDAEGFVWVADTHYNQVVKFAPDGKIVFTFGKEGTQPGEFFWPCAIVIDQDGTVFTAEYGGHDRIQKWSGEGKLLANWGKFGVEKGSFMRPAGLALGADGLLYVADAANHRVQVFTREGKFVRAWGKRGDKPGEFNYPYDVSIDASNRVFLVEYGASRLQVFSPTGDLLGWWGKLGRDGESLSHPWGVDVTPAGKAYVADTYNFRVTVIDEKDWVRK
jgi:DNA-binding beta-propeller fold protein YncE